MLVITTAAVVLTGAAYAEERTAVFAGGCFWCVEPPFDKLEGVMETTSGFANGHVANPTYDEVSAGDTGHTEAVKVTYDSERVSYRDLLEAYWPNTDPLDGEGQFCDRGATYRPAIFFGDEMQREEALRSRDYLQREYGWTDVGTSVEELTAFYPAEDYHQDYYEKNPIRYNVYRWACGRDARLDEVWGDTEHLDLSDRTAQSQ